MARANLPAATTASAAYNVNNQLTNWNGTTLSYDLIGNMTSDGIRSFNWNARNQLTSIGTTTFQYDGFGRRSQNGAGVGFVYDGLNPVQEIVSGTPRANLLTGGLDEFFARTDSGGTSSFLTDALGSTLALADSTATVQTQYTFDPFGNTASTGASSTNAFEYTGRENDGSGIYYYRARYYNPTLARFISEDPIGFGGGQINLYAYVGNAPVDLLDPKGTSLPGVHWDETYNAAIQAGYTPGFADELARAVVHVDLLPGSQGTDAGSTHMHGMGGRKDNGNPESRCQAYHGAVNALNQDIQDAQKGSRDSRQDSLAKALHLIQDSYPSGHQYQLWDGGFYGIPSGPHRRGDSVHIPAAEASTLQLLEALEGNMASGSPARYLSPPPPGCN